MQRFVEIGILIGCNIYKQFKQKTMVQKSRLTLLCASLMMLGLSFGFTSCSSDDDDVTKEPTLEVVKGDYSGKMNVVVPTPKMSLLEAAEAEGANVNATLKNDTVFFEDFPMEDIIALIVPEEQVSLIVAALGKVSYNIGYKASFNGAKDGVVMELAPKPLELFVSLDEENAISVKIDISATNKGAYSVKDKTLAFGIEVDKVTLNDEVVEDFISPSITFNMSQK